MMEEEGWALSLLAGELISLIRAQELQVIKVMKLPDLSGQ